MISLKSTQDIEIIHTNGRLLSVVLGKVKRQAKPGVSTLELAKLAQKEIFEVNGESDFIGYKGFLGAICISLNDKVVHDVPSPSY